MTTTQIIYSLGALLVSAGVLLLARVIYARFEGYNVDEELTESDNPAVGTAMFGFLGGIIAVLVSLLATDAAETQTSSGLQWDLAELAIYGLYAVFLLKIAGWLNDRFVLRGFDNQKELVQDRNVGVGAVLGGTYLASGIILAGALSGRVDPEVLGTGSQWSHLGFELLLSTVFFLLGQLAIVIYSLVYQMVQKHDILDAIQRDYEVDGQTHGGNTAAGMAFGGNILAFSIVLFAGAQHDFSGWSFNLMAFGLAALVGLILLPTWRLFVDHIMLPDADLAKEIYEDRNINAALLESICMIGLALIILLVMPEMTAA